MQRRPYSYVSNVEVTREINDCDYALRNKNIEDNLDVIMELLENCLLDKISNILFPYCHYNFSIVRELVRYALTTRNIKLLKLIFISREICNIDIDEFDAIFCYGHVDMVRDIMDDIPLKLRDFSLLITSSKHAIAFLELFRDKGQFLNYPIIYDIIEYCHVDALTYVFKHHSNIQDIVNKINRIAYVNIIPMLDLMFANNIVITHLLNLLFTKAFKYCDLNVLEYLIKRFPDYDMSNNISKWQMINNKIEIAENIIPVLKFTFKHGYNIHNITDKHIISAGIEVIKFLIDLGYNVSEHVLSVNIRYYFSQDLTLDNVKYLLNHGGNLKYVISKECKCNYERQKLENRRAHKYPRNIVFFKRYNNFVSCLEHTVAMGKMEHIKFLINEHYSFFEPEIDRLWVIACANGQLSLAKYFVDLGCKLSPIALVTGVFFGHGDVVQWLLDLGLKFEDNPAFNMWDVVLDGQTMRLAVYNETYHYMTVGNDVFKNDAYNYGNDYDRIHKLLVDHLVPVPYDAGILDGDYDVFNIDILTYLLDNELNLLAKRQSDGSLLNPLEVFIRKQNIPLIKLILKYMPNPQINDEVTIKTLESNDELRQILIDCNIWA